MVVIDDNKVHFYMDNHLNEQLTVITEKVRKDDDMVFCITGPERSGKSVFAMQLAYRVDPSFNLSRVCMSPEEFREAVINAKKGQAVVYDEAYRGLNSRSAMTETNRSLVSLMSEMGQLNLFVFVVLPSFFVLDWYVAVHRSRGLFVIYRKKGDRGYWMFFNKKKKDYWYELPRHLRVKHQPKSSFKGRFYEQYVVNEKEYRLKKKKSLRIVDKPKEKNKKWLNQRNMILKKLYSENRTLKEVREFCEEAGFKITQKAIHAAIENIK